VNNVIVDGCTRGVWLWGAKMEGGKSFLLLDTEGLEDSGVQDGTRDLKLFVMTMMLSSCMIYNVLKQIDEHRIQKLGY